MNGIHTASSLAFVYDTKLVPPLEKPIGFEFRVLDGTGVHHFFGAAEEDQWRRREYIRLLDRGNIGLLLHDDSGWAAIQWISTPDSDGPPHISRALTRDRYWCFYEHTRAHHRRRGLWRALKTYGVHQVGALAQAEALRLYSDTEPDNTASINAHRAFGFRDAGVITTRSLRLPRISPFNFSTWDHGATDKSRASERNTE